MFSFSLACFDFFHPSHPSLYIWLLHFHFFFTINSITIPHSFTVPFFPDPPSPSPSSRAWTCWSAVSISVFPLGSDSAHPVSHPVYCHSIPLCSQRASGGRPPGLSAWRTAQSHTQRSWHHSSQMFWPFEAAEFILFFFDATGVYWFHVWFSKLFVITRQQHLLQLLIFYSYHCYDGVGW